MKKNIAALVLGTCLSMGALASPTTFVVDQGHSIPRFSYNHFGFSTQMSRFANMSGKIVLDFDKKTGTMDISIDTKSLDSGYEKLTNHLKGPDFFDVNKYPEATFKSTLITFDGDRPSMITGNLTLHGVTQSVNFIVTSFKHGPHGFLQNREAIGGTATATVSRTAFGLGRYVPNVSDDVTVTISLEAPKE